MTIFPGRLLARGALAAGIAACTLTATAQTYPARPVRVIVPFVPGGADIAARILAQKLTDKLGQSFVIDNRGGAAGVLGTALAAKAPADGYTLLFCTASHAVTAVYYKKLPFDPVNDFAPIAAVGSVPFVLVTHPSLPVRSVRQFVALAKARPGELFYSSPGTGSIGHLANVLFAKRTNIEVTHVTYKGTGPALGALLAGEVQFALPNLTGALTQLRAGKLRALGVAAAQRSPLAADLPTIVESGVDLVSGTWYGVLAPHGTPQAIIDLLSQEIGGLLKTPELREQFALRGLVPDIMTTREFADFIRAEIDKWSGVIRDGRIDRE
jgi:tripartite-type tricarboxylate transporter receptor subunit TctC